MSLPRHKLTLERAFERTRMAAELMEQAYETLLPVGRLRCPTQQAVPSQTGQSLLVDEQGLQPDQVRMAKGA
jgi:hypothetical protein